MKEKKIKIKIFAVVSRGEGDEAEREKIRITGNGVMTCEGNRIEIRYDEILGEDGPAVNTLSFDTGDRSVVTLVRVGAVSSVMTFSEKARYGGNYDAGFAAFEFTVAARRVSNTVSFEKGGVLVLDYNTEIQGVPVQESRFRFDIVCDGEAYIDGFPNHPFQVKKDKEMEKLMESIKTYGVLTPIIVRKKENERYEIISGHRRKRACELLGIELIQVILKDMTQEEAIIAMVDSNLQREKILPSEKARAYKMKSEAMKRQGMRTDLTLSPMATKLPDTASRIGQTFGESRDQVFRYIRLTELIPEILEMVDEGKIAFRPAVEISYLKKEQQEDLLETMKSEEVSPSLSQAIKMKGLSQNEKLDMDKIFEIMTEEKKNQVEKVKIAVNKLDKYFPRGTPSARIEETIIRALEYYQARKQENDSGGR